MSEEQVIINKPEEVYAAVVETFNTGFHRLAKAEATFARLACAYLEFSALQAQDKESCSPDVVRHFREVPKASFENSEYITNLSHFTYASTLFDTFLTETTTFLLLLFPSSIGDKLSLEISDILDAGSTYEIISEAAGRKARSISFGSVSDRLKFLREKYGLALILEEDELKDLISRAEKRNSIVHDQGSTSFELNNSGEIAAKESRCPKFPTPISAGEIVDSARLFTRLANRIASEVQQKCLNLDSPVQVVEWFQV